MNVEELLNSPEFQKLLPYVPYLVVAGMLRIILLVTLSLQIDKTINLIKEENRCLRKGHAWLMILPLFNIYWNFIVVRRMVDSFNNEFYDRQVAVEENPTLKMGYLFAGAFLAYNFPMPMFIGLVVFIISTVGLLLYLIKIIEYKKLLIETSRTDQTF